MIATLVSRTGQRLLMLALTAATLGPLVGCSSITSKPFSVPAHRIDRHFLVEPREGYGPVPPTALGQPKPAAHIIGPGDRLAAYVYGVFPPGQDETPILQRFQTLNQRYYPPRGEVTGPTTGLPVEVFANGTIQMPLIGEVLVAGLTVPEAREKLRDAFIEGEYISEEKARVTLSLVIPRVVRVNIFREDALTPQPDYAGPQTVRQRTRGGGEIVDLPIYENDVLHALGVSGGLPGTDAPRALWVFRQSQFKTPVAIDKSYLDDLANTAEINGCNAHITKIPLVWHPGQPLPFGPKDVILEEGDCVYIPRRNEYFYTGGLLRGAKIPLPRDEDIDVLEAIALATNSVVGPLGSDGRALQSGSPGYVIPPTRCLVIRQLPDGRTLPIRVDLRKALRDPKQRIYIKKDDLLVLTCTPGAAVTNTIANLFNFTVLTRSNDLFGGD